MAYGISTGYPDLKEPGSSSSAISNTNLRIYMESVRAAGLEKVRLDYNGTSGSTTDQFVNAAVNAGLGVLLINRTNLDPSGSTSSYASACTTMVNYYKDRVFEYELGNEMNIQGWSNGAQYAPFGKAGGDAIRAAQPAAFILQGAISNFGTVGSSDSRVPTNWLTSIYSVKGTYGTSWFDAVNYHPYGYSRNASGASMMANASGWPIMFDTSPSLRSIMVANGDSAKKIYATEHGAPTWSDGSISSDWLAANFPADQGVLEQPQADQAVLTIKDWNSRNAAQVGDVYFYSFRDRIPQSGYSGNREGHFGWQRTDLSAKPVLTQTAALLRKNPKTTHRGLRRRG